MLAGGRMDGSSTMSSSGYNRTVNKRFYYLLVALALSATLNCLLYLFVFVVPPWYNVQVDRQAISNYINSSEVDQQTADHLRHHLEHDPRFFSRAGNSFRECHIAENTYDGNLTVQNYFAPLFHRTYTLAKWGLSENGSSNLQTSLTDSACWFLDFYFDRDISHLGSQERHYIVLERCVFIIGICLIALHFVAAFAAILSCCVATLTVPSLLKLAFYRLILLCLTVALLVLVQFDSSALDIAMMYDRFGNEFPTVIMESMDLNKETLGWILLFVVLVLDMLGTLLSFILLCCPRTSHPDKQQLQQYLNTDQSATCDASEKTALITPADA